MQTLVDNYILDVLMRDLAGHERSPSAFLVYLYIWRQSVGTGLKVVPLSLQQLAEGTGLSKSAAQAAVKLLKRRKLLSATLKNPTAIPVYRAERPWAARRPR